MTISTSTEANNYSLIDIAVAQSKIADTLKTLEAHKKTYDKYAIQLNNYFNSKSDLQKICLVIQKDINTHQMDPSTVPHANQLVGEINTLYPSFEQLEKHYPIFNASKNQLISLINEVTKIHSQASQIMSDISMYQKIDIEKIKEVFDTAELQPSIKKFTKKTEESQSELYQNLIEMNSAINVLHFSALDLYRTSLPHSNPC